MKRNRVNKGLVIRETNPVGIDHHVVDRLFQGILEDTFEVGMKGRFTSGELQNIRLSFGGHESIDCAANLFERLMLLAWSTIGIAHRASQVTVVRNFQNSDTSVLFVIGAQTAIEWATFIWLDLRVPW
jgi:hypothetical protein